MKAKWIPPVLPKWPQMITSGRPVRIEQAKEIIRRTNTFFEYPGGNDHKFTDKWSKKLFMPQTPQGLPGLKNFHEKHNKWNKKWETIITQYVTNNWISSCFIGGTYGWCHPDGQIGYIDNVGKWPTVEGISEDWLSIIKAFPFLDIAITLMNGEYGESSKQPIVSMIINRGKVRVIKPDLNIHLSHPQPTRNSGGANLNTDIDEDLSKFRIGDYSNEHGIPESWLKDWAKLAEKKFGR